MEDKKAFANEVSARLTPLGPVSARPMFGGFGIYLDGVMFGIIASGILYFRVDETTRADYERTDSGPFTYNRKGRTVEMDGYWRVPAKTYEDPERLIHWAERAHDTARRSKYRAKRARRD